MKYKYTGIETVRMAVNNEDVIIRSGDIVESEKELVGNFELLDKKVKKKVEEE